MQKLHTTVYTDLDALPSRYEPLLSRAGDASLFLTLPWYRNFAASALAPSERLRIYAVEAAADVASPRAVLMMRHQIAGPGVFRGRTLSGLSNYYTSLFGPAMEALAADAPAVLGSLVGGMTGDEVKWDTIDLHPLAVDTPVFPALASAFRNAGFMAQPYFCFGNWYLRTRGRSYAEYFDALPSQLKNTVTRKRRKLEKEGRLKLVLCRDEASLAEAMGAYQQIYARSWKIPEPCPDFIPGLCRTCAGAGWLRLGVAYVDGQPAAAQIWIVNAGIASIYKLAYDERFANLSAGSILSAHLMEHVIDVDKVHEVDYLTGDDAYKRDWMSDRRERWGLMAFNLRTPRGALAAARHWAGRAARRSIDAVRGRGAAGN